MFGSGSGLVLPFGSPLHAGRIDSAIGIIYYYYYYIKCILVEYFKKTSNSGCKKSTQENGLSELICKGQMAGFTDQ